jgi:hypothetical protein
MLYIYRSALLLQASSYQLRTQGFESLHHFLKSLSKLGFKFAHLVVISILQLEGWLVHEAG